LTEHDLCVAFQACAGNRTVSPPQRVLGTRLSFSPFSRKETKAQSGRWGMPVVSALRRQGEENCEFETSWGYTGLGMPGIGQVLGLVPSTAKRKETEAQSAESPSVATLGTPCRVTI
jgi:hypothetical protein